MNFTIRIALVLALVTCVCAESAVRISRVVPKSGNRVLMKAKCVYKITEKIPVGEAQFTIAMDTALTRFKSKQVQVLSIDDDERTFHVENIKRMKPNRFTAKFSVFYDGDENTPVPSGTCSDLRFPGTTQPPKTTLSTTSVTSSTASTSPTTSSTTSAASSTISTNPTKSSSISSLSTTSSTTSTMSSTTSTTTSTPVPKAVSATVHKEWPEGDCTRVYAFCDFPVNSTFIPETVDIGIEFSASVKRVKQWQGELLTSDGNKRYDFTNKYYINPPSLRYTFEATYEGNIRPEMECYDLLGSLLLV